MNTIDRIRAQHKIVRAALYARFSSENQRNESIDAQIRAMEEYAKKNDFTIVEHYIDKARSATTDNRPSFLRMIEDSAHNMFDVILVHKLDRFARNRQDSIANRIKLKRNNVSLISVLEYLDENSPESVILESVLEAMSEYYSLNLAREVRKGMKENALKCKATGGIPPLGYDTDRISRTLFINEQEAVIVRLIFQRFLEGVGYDRITRELNEKGFVTKVGNPFGKNSIQAILRNEKYKGTYVFNKVASKNVDGKRNNHSYKPDDEIIRIDGGVPAIISEEDFDAVQTKMQIRKHQKAANTAKEVYLLSGLIFCGECGSTYVGNRKFSGRNKRLHISYRCNRRDRNAAQCCNKELRREYIEGFILDKLSDFIFDDRLIPILYEQYSEYMRQQNAQTITALKLLKQRQKEILKEIDNIISVIAQTASASLCDKLNTLEEEKAVLDFKVMQHEQNTGSCDISVKQLDAAFKKARTMFSSGTLETIQKLITTYVDRIYVYESHVEVCFRFLADFTPPPHPRLRNENIPTETSLGIPIGTDDNGTKRDTILLDNSMSPIFAAENSDEKHGLATLAATKAASSTRYGAFHAPRTQDCVRISGGGEGS